MDIQKEREAFLNVYVNYKGDSRKIQFNEETEQFMWRKNNVSDTEVEYVHLMNQRWYAWLACAKSKAQAVPAQLDVNSILHDIDCYFDNGLSNTERTANNLLQSIYEKLSGEVKAQEPANEL